MSIASGIARIQEATATIRSKYVELGIAQSTDKIDALATASENIENKGAVTAIVTEGTTYTIPKGYHNGSGTVTGAAPAEDATAETWETPDMTGPNTPAPFAATASQNSETAWRAFDGNLDTYWSTTEPSAATDTDYDRIVFDLGSTKIVKGIRIRLPNSSFTEDSVNPKLQGDTYSYVVAVGVSDDPDNIQNVSVLSGNVVPDELTSYEFDSNKSGRYIEISNRGIDTSLNNDNGAGPLSCQLAFSEIEILTLETVGKYSLQGTKVITPTTQQQSITPDSGFYGLSSVTINAIPVNYKDVSVVTAKAEDVLVGKTIVDSSGVVTLGTMPNNGTILETIDGLTTTSVTIPAGYSSGGTISLDDSIEEALAAI